MADEARHLTVMDGREMVGSISGAGCDWCALDARGNLVPGSPFNSLKAAIGALNVARPSPCAADARLDNSP